MEVHARWETLRARVAEHSPEGMSVAAESGEHGFIPSLFIRDSGEHDPPPVGTSVTAAVLGRDTTHRLILSTRLRDMPGQRPRPVAAEDSCDWCYAAATPTSLAACQSLGLTDEQAHACDACIATEEFRKEPPGGWYEDSPWPWLIVSEGE